MAGLKILKFGWFSIQKGRLIFHVADVDFFRGISGPIGGYQAVQGTNVEMCLKAFLSCPHCVRITGRNGKWLSRNLWSVPFPCMYLLCWIFFQLGLCKSFFSESKIWTDPPNGFISAYPKHLGITHIQLLDGRNQQLDSSNLGTIAVLYPWKVSFRGQMKSNYLSEIFPNLSPLAHMSPMKAVYSPCS